MVSGFFALAGIGAGLPSEEQTRLVFSEEGVLSSLSPAMKSLRNDVYESYKVVPGVEVRKSYAPPSNGIVTEAVIDGKPLKIEAVKIHAMRSALLQSRMPDEQYALRTLGNIKPALGQFNPHAFFYGGFYIYSAGFALKVAETFGLLKVTSDIEFYFRNPEQTRLLFIIPKVLGGLAVAACVPAIFLLAGRLYGEKAALLSAFFMAVLPAAAVEAHALKPYTFFLPFMLFSLYFSARIMEEGRGRHYLLAGIFAGLSAGSLIISGTAVFAAAAGHFLFERKKPPVKERSSNLRLLIAAAGFFVSFCATNPYFFLAFREMANELGSNSEIWGFKISLAQAWHHFVFEFPKEFGGFLYISAAAGLALALFTVAAGDILLMAVFIPFYIYLTCVFWSTHHYDMPAVPIMVILAARFFVWAGEKLKRTSLINAAAAAVALLTFCCTAHYSLIYLMSDRHFNSAGRWINENLPPGLP
ncbi:MAG: glycosyltransferase family 39 protein [bacterium]